MKLLAILLLVLSSTAAVADKASECTRLWELEKEMGCPAMPNASASPARENFLVNSEFGPSKCVIEDNLDKEKKELKKECDDWIKERKADLGSTFLTGTCNASCGPCPKNETLRRCTYKGEVHYSVK